MHHNGVRRLDCRILVPVMVPITSYVICTNPRSGSGLLSEGLASTSLAGNPREWFNPIEEQQHREEWHIEGSTDPGYSSYLDHVLEHGKTSNGIFGTKLHYCEFAELPKKLATIEKYRGLEISQLMLKAFPNLKYIWLTRRDKARQAISFHRARKTYEWWLIDGVRPIKPGESVDEPDFDAQAIQAAEQILLQNDRNWQLYFRNNNIAPLILDYEDLATDYKGNILRVLKWLCIPDAEAVSIPPPRLKRQSDSRSEEWLARYLNFKMEAEHPKASSPAQNPGEHEDNPPQAKCTPSLTR
jgi:trehalose 2-sulfotransferase